MIRIEKLNKYYNFNKDNEIQVVKNTTLEFGDKGMVCILGESGSGKTSLLNVVGGLDNFTSGKIDVDGVSMKRYDSAKWDKIRNEKYGYVFQNYYLLKDRTVHFNIMLALNIYDLTEEEKEYRVDYVLKSVGMTKYKKRLVSQLSGGQQQRVAIARALAKSPNAIIADEPTGNLDEKNTIQMMNIIKKISQECLVILVTHERKLAEFYGDRIINITDGKVVSDHVKTVQGEYKYGNDDNVYLKEYKKSTIDNENLTINTYTNDQIPKTVVDIVYEEDAIFIKVDSGKKVEYVVAGGERQIIDSEKPNLVIEDVENFEYNLPKLKPARSSRLSFKEIFKTAKSNIKNMPKRRKIMFVVYIIMAAMMVITASNVLSALEVNEQKCLYEDRNIVRVSTTKTSGVSFIEERAKFAIFIDSLDKANIEYKIYPNIAASISLNYEEFLQVERLKIVTRDHSFIGIEQLNSEDIVYGRMPEAPYEIVMDEWVILNMLGEKSIISNLVNDYRYFLGKTCIMDKGAREMTIVGISRTQNPSLYLSEYDLYSLTAYAEQMKVVPLSYMQERFDGYDDVVLTDYQVMTLADKNDYVGFYSEGVKTLFLRVGSCISEDCGVDAVLSEEGYKLYVKGLAIASTETYFYTNDKARLIEAAQSFTAPSIKLKYLDFYQEQVQAVRDQKIADLKANLIITATIIAASLLVLYFTMRSNAISNIYNIGVYRSIGISKFSIVMIYVMEIFIITTFTSLVGACLTAAVIKTLSYVPAFEGQFILTGGVFLCINLGIYVLNIIIGIIPILSIINIPPAQLSMKYDI